MSEGPLKSKLIENPGAAERQRDAVEDGVRGLVIVTATGPRFVPLDKIAQRLDVTPPKSGPSAEQLHLIKPLLEELLAIDRAHYRSDPSRAFGLEARFVHFIAGDEGASKRDGARHVLLRPAPEPILYSYWGRFARWEVDSSSILAMASCLCGRDIAFRDTRGATFPNESGVSVFYPPADSARTWLARLPRPKAGMDLLTACTTAFGCLGAFVLEHPLTDGNGRTGHALFQGILARSVGMSSPMLALGVLTAIRKTDIVRAWIQLGVDGDWTDLLGVYQNVLEDCLTLHHRHILGLNLREHR